jgi:hypothetical protein
MESTWSNMYPTYYSLKNTNLKCNFIILQNFKIAKLSKDWGTKNKWRKKYQAQVLENLWYQTELVYNSGSNETLFTTVTFHIHFSHFFSINLYL